METRAAIEVADTKPAVRPTRCRWQFSLLSLFLLTTVTCLILSWWVWPRPAEVVAVVNASATPLPVSQPSVDGGPREVVVYQLELLQELRSAELLKDAVSVPGNGNLRLFRDRSEPTEWLRRRLQIEVIQPSTIVIRLKVPKHLRAEGVEVVDYIATKCISRTMVNVGRRTREYLNELRRKQLQARREFDTTRKRPARSARPSELRIAVEPALIELQAEIAQLELAIKNAQQADNTSQHLQLVQMATAVSDGK